jgi:hypothetical protein
MNDRRRLALLLLLLGLAAVDVTAQPVVATYTAVHNAIRVEWSIAGMPDATDCVLTLKDVAGGTVATVTSLSGGGLPTRTELVGGLSASTNYKLTINCGTPFEIINDQWVSTLASPGGSTTAVPIQLSAPATFTTSTRAKVLFGSTPALGSELQNTSCSTGCTISPSMNYGFQYFAIQRQTTANGVLGQVPTQGIVIGESVTSSLTSSASSAEPPIPRLATWESNMTTYGAVTCNNFVAQGVNFGTYYDGLESMERIRAYRLAAGDGDVSAWSTCSNTANSVYRSYVLTNNGAVPGYNHFTTGFRIHFARTAEADSKKANAYMAGYRLIDSIGNGAAYCGFSDYVSVSPKRQREIAYCTRSVLNYVAEGGVSQDAKRDLMVGNIVTYHLPGRIGTRTTAATFDVDSEAPGICANRYYVSPFMQAISAYTLIQYYEEVNPDPAIHESIRWTADWIWANAYMPDKKTFWYQNCKDTVAEPWPATVGGGPSLPTAAVDLNLLFVKLYIWLYRNGSSCGDTTYRDKADILFDEGVRLGNTFLGYDGKHFNQNYTWSFDYVAMRKLPAPTCS